MSTSRIRGFACKLLADEPNTVVGFVSLSAYSLAVAASWTASVSSAGRRHRCGVAAAGVAVRELRLRASPLSAAASDNEADMRHLQTTETCGSRPAGAGRNTIVRGERKLSTSSLLLALLLWVCCCHANGRVHALSLPRCGRLGTPGVGVDERVCPLLASPCAEHSASTDATQSTQFLPSPFQSSPVGVAGRRMFPALNEPSEASDTRNVSLVDRFRNMRRRNASVKAFRGGKRFVASVLFRRRQDRSDVTDERSCAYAVTGPASIAISGRRLFRTLLSACTMVMLSTVLAVPSATASSSSVSATARMALLHHHYDWTVTHVLRRRSFVVALSAAAATFHFTRRARQKSANNATATVEPTVDSFFESTSTSSSSTHGLESDVSGDSDAVAVSPDVEATTSMVAPSLSATAPVVAVSTAAVNSDSNGKSIDHQLLLPEDMVPSNLNPPTTKFFEQPMEYVVASSIGIQQSSPDERVRQAYRQPQTVEDEKVLQERYASIESLEDRAYQILLDLDMI